MQTHRKGPTGQWIQPPATVEMTVRQRIIRLNPSILTLLIILYRQYILCFFFLPSLDENKLVLLLKLLIFKILISYKIITFFSLGFMFLFIWEQKWLRNCSAKRSSCKTEEYMYLRADEYMHSALRSSILCCVGWPQLTVWWPWPPLATTWLLP